MSESSVKTKVAAVTTDSDDDDEDAIRLLLQALFLQTPQLASWKFNAVRRHRRAINAPSSHCSRGVSSLQPATFS